MSATENPAKLLYDILDKAQSSVENTAEGNGRVWQLVFELTGPELATKLTEVQRLPDEIRRVVGRSDIDPVPVDRTMSRIELAFVEGGTARSWAEFWSAAGGEGTLDFLSMTAGYVAVAGQSEYSIDDVDGLRGIIGNLLEEIRHSDLDEQIRKLVEQHLSDLLASLTGLDARTTNEFKRRAAELIGLIASIDDVYLALKNSKAGKALFTTLAALVVAHGTIGIETKPALELGAADSAVIRCIDPARVPALGPGSPVPAALPAEQPAAPDP